MNRVISKRQNYRLWRSGAYGNKLRAWRSVEEWRASGFSETVALRYLGDAGGGRCTYDLRPEDVDAEVERWVRDGADESGIMVNEMNCGTEVLQGEYYAGSLLDQDGRCVLEPFYHSFDSVPMREALARSGSMSYGLRSRLLLRRFMTAASYEDFTDLVEAYPNHVLEVSVFDRPLGDLPRRNAVVWEVRIY